MKEDEREEKEVEGKNYHNRLKFKVRQENKNGLRLMKTTFAEARKQKPLGRAKQKCARGGRNQILERNCARKFRADEGFKTESRPLSSNASRLGRGRKETDEWKSQVRHQLNRLGRKRRTKAQPSIRGERRARRLTRTNRAPEADRCSRRAKKTPTQTETGAGKTSSPLRRTTNEEQSRSYY